MRIHTRRAPKWTVRIPPRADKILSSSFLFFFLSPLSLAYITYTRTLLSLPLSLSLFPSTWHSRLSAAAPLLSRSSQPLDHTHLHTRTRTYTVIKIRRRSLRPYLSGVDGELRPLEAGAYYRRRPRHRASSVEWKNEQHDILGAAEPRNAQL